MNRNNQNKYPCLFCGDYNKNRTKEHILQRGFGSNWTLPNDVCEECNTQKFSSLDKCLVDFTQRCVYYNHPDIRNNKTLLQQGYSIWLNESIGIWKAVRIQESSDKTYPIPLDQIIILPNGNLIFLPNPFDKNKDYQSRFDKIKQELSAPSNINHDEMIFIQEDTSLPSLCPIIIRSRPNKYLILAATQEEIIRTRDNIYRFEIFGNFKPSEEPINYDHSKRSNPGVVKTNFVVETSKIERALAKSAINIVCDCLGSERARSPILDPIKNFVLFDTLYKNTGFVTHLWGAESNNHQNLVNVKRFFKHFVDPDHHTIVLLSKKNQPLIVGFILYQEPFAIVQLSENLNFLSPEENYVIPINYKNKPDKVNKLDMQTYLQNKIKNKT